MDEHSRIGPHPLTLAVALGMLSVASPLDLSAQWALEGRAGSAIPMGELTDDPGPNQTAGLAFAGSAMFNFQQNFSFYVDGSWQKFNCDGCPTDIESWGFDGGLKYVFAESGSAFVWARAGVALQQASAGDAEGEWGVGFDSGLGIDWLLTEQFALVPAARFDFYEAGDLSVSYVTIDLGAHWHLE